MLLRATKESFGSRMLQTAQFDAAQGAMGQTSQSYCASMLLLTGGCSSVSAMFGEATQRSPPGEPQILEKVPKGEMWVLFYCCSSVVCALVDAVGICVSSRRHECCHGNNGAPAASLAQMLLQCSKDSM
jgi:hypothetical protein